MDIFIADDSKQERPTRPGMRPLVSAGGLYVPGDNVHALEREIERLCEKFGFPRGEEFKWSPRRDLWMFENLVREARKDFFISVLGSCVSNKVTINVMVNDTSYNCATNALTHEHDVTRLLVERIHWRAKRKGTHVIVVFDRPGGNRAAEDKFLARCLEDLQTGTDYVFPDRIATNPLSTDSRFLRLLQAADLVTSCATAYVAGENRYSPPIFDHIKPLFDGSGSDKGGVGLKIHPDYIFCNLYHWFFGQKWHQTMKKAVKLPNAGSPYSKSSDEW